MRRVEKEDLELGALHILGLYPVPVEFVSCPLSNEGVLFRIAHCNLSGKEVLDE